VLLALLNGEDDRYNALPDWDKDTYWHFFVGQHHFRLPKPFELGAVFASMPERIVRRLTGKDSTGKMASRIGAIVSDQLAMDPVPQLFRPALNVYANKDNFRNTPIETLSDEGKLPSERVSPRTSDTSRVAVQAIAPVADKIGLSPKRLEYLIGGYFGTVGMYALGASDLLVRQMEDRPATPAWRADDIPGIKAFYRVEPARSTVYESDLYELRTEIEKVYKSAKAHEREGDDAKAQALHDRFPKELAAREAINDGAKELSDIHKEMNRIYADSGLSPQKKRQLIDELTTIKNTVAKDVMQIPEVRALQ
jgi:hypothetical protein